MLTALSIRDIVLIDRLDIDFSAGLSVLSGETGAGKSILLDSLSLSLGARGDGGLVRSGCENGQVSAVFDVPHGHPAQLFLIENQLADSGDDGEIILRRQQNADGRTRAWVNDRPVSAGLLREVGRMLVEIHGQHDERALVEAEAHRRLVDAFGGLGGEAAAVSSAYGDWRAAENALHKLRARVEQAAKEADYLRASVEELTLLAPADGEEDRLADQRQAMMEAEKAAADIAEAHDMLAGSASPVPNLANLLRRLERKAETAPALLAGPVDALGAALDALARTESELEAAIRQTEFDPAELERTEERLFALRAASRKYGVAVANLPEHAARLAQDLADLDAGEEKLAALEKEAARSRTRLDTAAAALSARRHEAAGKLAAQVMQELPALKLDQARFFVHIDSEPDRVSADGIDSVEFHVQTNPGTRPGPLMKVASGGELSRFLLALKVALADRGSAPTLIFDEIDSGAGGAVADAIGARLGRLAQNVQVLCVTHAPQVAARAGGHYLISKGAENGGDSESVLTRVTGLEGPDRQEEIARMLAGAEITDEARAAAARLIGA